MLSFTSNLYNKLVVTLTLYMINRSEAEEQLRIKFQRKHFLGCQIFLWKIDNASDFKSWCLQRVRFWVRCFTASEALKKKLLSTFHFWLFLLRKNDQFALFVLVWKAWLWLNFYNVSVLQLEKIHLVRLWIKISGTGQILNYVYNASYFWLWIKF